jgi:hypothetical protein
MLLPPPQAGIVSINPTNTSDSIVLERRRRNDGPTRKVPTKLAPKLTAHQSSPLNPREILTAGCGAVVLTLTVVEPLPVIDRGLKAHLLSDGRPAHAKLIAPVKPGDAATPNVVVPGNPSVTVILASEVGRQKSAAVMVKLTGEELLALKLWSPE